MHCGEFEQRLDACLDRQQRADYDRALLRHTQRCARCHELLAAHQQLVDSLGARSMPETTDDFADKIVYRVRGLGRRRRWWTAAQYLMTGSVAALLLVVLQTSSSRREPSTPAQVPSGNQGSTAVNLRNDNGLVTPSLFGVASVAKWNNWAKYKNRIPAVNQLLPESATAAGTATQVRSPLAQGLRPVTASLASALKVIGSSLPATQERSSDGQHTRNQLRRARLAIA